MTVAEWIKKNGKDKMYSTLRIVNRDNYTILNDKLAYLKFRPKEYNKRWRNECSGKQIIRTLSNSKGIIIQIDTIKGPNRVYGPEG